MVRAPDKGYVFAGWVSPIPANGDTGTQDIWLLKTDSLLCEYQSCPIAYLAVKEYVNNFNENISVYPNPANDKITISLSEPNNSLGVIKLFDIQGKELFSEKTESNSFVLSLRQFNSGIYFLEIKKDFNSVTKKIIKQ